MAAVDEVIQKLDECIKTAKAVFDDQFQILERTRGQKPGPIAFSNGTKLTQFCIACNKSVVDYAIFGRWVEKETEGQANVSWKCKTCRKPYVLRGPQKEVMHKLMHLSYQPRAA
jgi:uncharacterized protein with PIN domain